MSQHSGLVALTGATGFIGRRLIPALQGGGFRVRALVRRDDPRLAGCQVEQCLGALEDPTSLAAFTAGADAVVHAAGLVLAAHPGQFHEVNVAGTRRLAETAAAAAVPRFLMISSLAAREPGLSPYAASKHAAEAALRELGSALDLAIVRPPAVYGPGDRATLPLFRQLARGFLLAPAAERARFSLIYVDDLAFLICGLLRSDTLPQEPIEPDDGQPGGYGWGDLGAHRRGDTGAAGAAVAPVAPAHGAAGRSGRGLGPAHRPAPDAQPRQARRAVPPELACAGRQRWAIGGPGPCSPTASRRPLPGTARRAGSAPEGALLHEHGEETVADDEVMGDVLACVAKLNKEGRPIGPETRLAADLGMDSVAAMDLVMALEDRFEIDIPLNRLGEIETVAQLAALVRERVQGA